MIFSEVVVKFFSYFKREFPAQESPWDFFNAWKAEQEKVQSQLRIVEETLMFSPDSTNLLIEKAKSLILLEKPMAAAEILRKVITSNPKDAEAISALAMSFYHQGDLKRCIETCDKALKLNPSMEDTKTMRTNASNFSDVFAKLPSESEKFGIVFWEERTLLKGFQIDRSNKWAEQKLRTILAHSYLKSGRYELCESNATILLESFGETAELYIARAECSLKFWETPEAAVDLMEAEKLNPSADGWSKIARLKTLKRDIESRATVNLYNFFSVHRNAAVSLIRQSFERMSLMYEDKLSKALTKAAKREFQKKLEAAEEAFDILGDETSRAEHDRNLKMLERSDNISVAFERLALTAFTAGFLWIMVLFARLHTYVACSQEFGAEFEASNN